MVNKYIIKLILAFSLPVFFTYSLFYGSLVFFIDFPIDYALGSKIVAISFLDQIHVMLLICIFVGLLVLPQVALEKLTAKSVCTSNLFSIKAYIFIGCIAFVASLLNCVIKLPNGVENIIRILSLLSLYIISYGLFQINKVSEVKYRKIIFLIITSNILAFAIIPLFLGYLSKIILLMGSLLFVMFYDKADRKKFKFLLIFIVGAVVIGLIFQSYKSDYRKILFGGHFKKIITKQDWVDNKFHPGCNIRQYYDNLPISKVYEISNRKYDQHRLDLYETGNLILDFESANALIKKNYSSAILLSGLQDFQKSAREALDQDNFLLLLGISRAWGNSLPRDGTRAARLLINSADKMPALSNAIFGTLLLDGNGIQADMQIGVQCAFESANQEIIDYVVRLEKGIIPSVIDRYVDSVDGGLKTQVEESRLKHMSVIKKSKPELGNVFSKLHTQLYSWTKGIDENLHYSISGGLDRLDQMRNFVVALKGYGSFSHEEYAPYRLILWSFAPRLLYPSKPLIGDEAGILIGKIFSIDDPHNPNLSWALPFFAELVIFGGLFNLFIGFFMISIFYSVYFYQGLRSINFLFLFGNMGLANILMGLFTGYVGVLSGLIQCYIFLQVAYVAYLILKRFVFAKIY